MSRVVRSSKFRHVFGQTPKKEECYEELKVTRNAWDSNFVAASSTFFAVIWDASGGGAFAALPFTQKGKFDLSKNFLVTGHKAAVLDLDFNPFIDNMVGSASEDCYAKIWSIPEEGLKANMNEPVQTLSGHKRKVGTIRFNPAANNVCATSSIDYSVKIWDVEKGTANISIEGKHTDIINAAEWNYTGSLLATICKDKKLRVIDPRTSEVIGETEAHQGIKGSRVIWLGNREKLLTTGFSKQSEREQCLWDPKDLTKPLVRTVVDSSSGLLLPFYDNDSSVLFIAGKGDANIKYYEVVDEPPYIHDLSSFSSTVAQRGLCMVPKRAVNVIDCEIVRFLKVSPNKVEPIGMQVPRKSDIFQDDLFPDCYSGEPSMQAGEWFGGELKDVVKIKTRPMGPTGEETKKRVVQEFKPEKVVEVKPLTMQELKDEVERLTKRLAYVEAESIKKDARIKELGQGQSQGQ